MRPHPAGLLRPSSVGLRIRKPGLPMPAAEWFEFSSFSPSAGIRSQIQEIRRKAKLALIKEVALASGVSLDHLVGAGEQRWRHSEAEYPCPSRRSSSRLAINSSLKKLK